MENFKNNQLSVSTNRNSFASNLISVKYSSTKYNPFNNKSLLNQINFQTLSNAKSETPKNIPEKAFVHNYSNIPEGGINYIDYNETYKKAFKQDFAVKKPSFKASNLDLKDESK